MANMTSGIYKLKFKGTDKCYIGQSTNIVQRYAVHRYSMINGTSSIKLLEAFKLYGLPELEVLYECDTKEDLNECEDIAIEIYDSIANGFNTLSSSSDIPVSCGELNGRAKISNSTVEEIFWLLITTKDILYSTISEHLKVPIQTIRRIASGQNHSWLGSKYPEEYKLLMSLKNTRRAHSKISGEVHPEIVSPDGTVYIIRAGSVKSFCDLHKLDRSHFGNVLKGKEKQHKGWKLKDATN